MPIKFFITHSWKDIHLARKLCNDLYAHGLEGFLDDHSIRPGQSIPSRIEQGLRECDVYIPILSPEAIKSEWCEKEINWAITLNLKKNGRPQIVPVLASPCSVPLRLLDLLYINFDGRYDDALGELLTKGFGGSDVKPAPPPPESLKQPSPMRNWLVPFGAIGGFILFVLVLLARLAWPPPTPTPVLTTGTPSAVSIPSPINVGVIAATSSASPTRTPSATITQVPTTPLPTSTSIPTDRLPTSTPVPTHPPTSTSVPTLPPPTSTLTPTTPPTSMPTATATPSPIPTPEGMVYIPTGPFWMGKSENDPSATSSEMPGTIIVASAFWIDKYEVSNAKFRECVAARRCDPPTGVYSSSSPDATYGNPAYDDYPVVFISQHTASRYCEWLGKRLPYEYEWEKAARGNLDQRIYPWGDTWDDSRANAAKNLAVPEAVTAYPNGCSLYGVCNMTGNVREWIADFFNANWYKDRLIANQSCDPIYWGQPTDPLNVRGGSFRSNVAQARISQRGDEKGDNARMNDVGFRCAISAP